LWTSIAAGIVSFGVAAMAGLNTFLNPTRRAEAHYRAANAFDLLRQEARNLELLECTKASSSADLEGKLCELQSKLAKLNEGTPIISQWAMDRATTKIRSGYYAYKVDGRAS
jgi:hypothetical protein